MLFDSSFFYIDECRIIIDYIHKTLNFHNRIQSSQNKRFHHRYSKRLTKHSRQYNYIDRSYVLQEWVNQSSYAPNILTLIASILLKKKKYSLFSLDQ